MTVGRNSIKKARKKRQKCSSEFHPVRNDKGGKREKENSRHKKASSEPKAAAAAQKKVEQEKIYFRNIQANFSIVRKNVN